MCCDILFILLYIRVTWSWHVYDCSVCVLLWTGCYRSGGGRRCQSTGGGWRRRSARVPQARKTEVVRAEEDGGAIGGARRLRGQRRTAARFGSLAASSFVVREKWPSRKPTGLYSRSIFRGGWHHDPPLKMVCRGGWWSHPPLEIVCRDGLQDQPPLKMVCRGGWWCHPPLLMYFNIFKNLPENEFCLEKIANHIQNIFETHRTMEFFLRPIEQ